MSRTSKLILISIFVLAGFLVFIFSRGFFGAKPAEKENNIAFILPEEIVLAEESIPLTWTDNNDNENLIIQSDRKYYDGRDSSEVYFSITNISEKDQKPDIKFLFDEKEGRGMKELALLNSQNDVIAVGQTNFYKAVIYYPQNSKGEFFIEAKGDNGGYGYLDPYYASGLVGMWSFSGADTNWTSATAGTTADKSGNNNTGTMTNMSRSTSPVIGKVGQALSFDGVNDYVTLTSAPISNFSNANTVCAWALTTNNTFWDGSYDQTIVNFYTDANNGVRFGNHSNNNGYGYPAGSFYISYKAGGTSYYRVYQGKLFENNTWVNVCYVWSGSAVSLYGNGVALSTSAAGTYSIDANNQTIGIRTAGSYGMWKGNLDEVRVYNRALSASEITDLYRVDSARAKFNTPLSGRFKDSSLVGYWSFDGKDMGATTATDLSGNGNTGTLTNGPQKVPGINGQALSFDGVNDYVSIPDPNLVEGLAAMSVSVWAKSDITVTANGRGIVAQSYGASGDPFLLYLRNVDNIAFQVSTGVSVEADANTDLPDTNWHHYVGVYNGSNVLLYVDSVLQTSQPAQTGTTTASTNPVTIGAYDSTRNWDGLIDETRIYNRALSATEVQEQYRAGAARMKVNSPPSAPFGNSGLVGYWSFNGPDIAWQTGTAYDRSGSGNNGTITNMSTTTSPVAGKVGQALSFDGVDDYVGVTTNNTVSGNYTVSAWVNPNHATSRFGIFSNRFSNENTFDFKLQNGIVIHGDIGNGAAWLTTSADATFTYSVGTWYHIVYVVTPTGYSIYANGNPVGSGSFSGTPLLFTTGNLPRIGHTDGTEYANGLIDEVRVYNRALSASEIQELYRLGTRKFQPTQ
ncbi:MAG: LamG domain-containing protein [Patescibacteria group bacterium]